MTFPASPQLGNVQINGSSLPGPITVPSGEFRAPGDHSIVQAYLELPGKGHTFLQEMYLIKQEKSGPCGPYSVLNSAILVYYILKNLGVDVSRLDEELGYMFSGKQDNKFSDLISDPIRMWELLNNFEASVLERIAKNIDSLPQVQKMGSDEKKALKDDILKYWQNYKAYLKSPPESRQRLPGFTVSMLEAMVYLLFSKINDAIVMTVMQEDEMPGILNGPVNSISVFIAADTTLNHATSYVLVRGSNGNIVYRIDPAADDGIVHIIEYRQLEEYLTSVVDRNGAVISVQVKI